jgi:hypothetical protein
MAETTFAGSVCVAHSTKSAALGVFVQNLRGFTGSGEVRIGD